MATQSLADKFSKHFPLKGAVTKDIFKDANRYDCANCVGALTFKAALGKNFNPKKLETLGIWGDSHGKLVFTDNSILIITTKTRANMMVKTKPCAVTFILVDNFNS